MTRGVRGAAAAVGAVAIWLASTTPALGTGEPALVEEIPATVSTHFYDLAIDQLPTLAGSPYLTAITPTSVLTLDWDFEVGRLDLATRESTVLGSLSLPPGARVLDISALDTVRPEAARAEVLIAYAWRAADGCRRSRLQEASIDLSGAEVHSLGRTWFQTPCFPSIDTMVNQGLAQAGGRVVQAPRTLQAKPGQPAFLFTIGDFELSRRDDVPLRSSARRLLSSVVLLTAPKRASIYSSGLRNPQGITTARAQGRLEILTSEHGPRGGDDINVLREGANFGWPRSSYGTAYSAGKRQDQPLREGRDDSGTPPLISFVPSIGPSSILEVRGSAFSRWWGPTKRSYDLIVNGMAAKSIMRLRVQDGAVRYVESTRLGFRLRTIVELPNGWLVGGLESAAMVVVLRPLKRWDSEQEAFVPVG